MSRIALRPQGITDLPPGKIAAVVTFLEMTEPAAPAGGNRPDLAVRLVSSPDLAGYRRLFRRVGEDWLWFSRAVMSDTELMAQLSRPGVELHLVERDGEALGFAELMRHQATVKIEFFGVVPEATGTGVAAFLMGELLRRAWRPGVERVWLHTCTLDHPAAIRFYLRQGFRPYKIAIEVADDPRLTGLLPITAAPHVPLILP